MKSKINVSKLGNEEIQDMFTVAFQDQIASKNNIYEFECICKRESSNADLKIEVMIIGMAGTPYLDMFKNGKVKNASTVLVRRDGFSEALKFNIQINESVIVNSNDYIVVYKME